MEFIFKKTNELSDREKYQICALFEEVFDAQKPVELFNKEFQETVKGYSYHTLMVDENSIKGVYSAIPVKYEYFGKKEIFALSVDTMIAQSHRGNPYTIKKMINIIYDELKKDDIHFIYGTPNKNYYLITKKVLKWKDIETLDYYVLPVKIGALNKKLSFLNSFSLMYSHLINSFVKNFDDVLPAKNIKKNIERINDEVFINWRCFDSSFKTVSSQNNFFSYKIKEYKGIKTAYIIDIEPLSKNLVESVVKYIYEKEKQNIDIILYTGNLDFKLLNLYKVPNKLNPRPYKVAGIRLDEKISEEVYDINNWYLNIGNFDFY